MKPATNKLFQLLVDFVHDEILDQFVNNNGNCDHATFWLINWSIVIDYREDGEEKLD